jgi:group I intron endonuclease
MSKKEKICGIYRIISPSGRVYIGESKDIEKRWKHYFKLLNCNTQRKLLNSFKKYGVENHVFEIIEECLFEDLKCRERYWQDLYDVLNKGLNCFLTKCGEIKKEVSEETKQKISEAQKQMRLNGKGNPPPPPMKGENNPMYGKTHSAETIEKIKRNKSSKKGEDHPNSNIYLDLEIGIYYFSMKEVAEVLNMRVDSVADRMCGRVKKKDMRIMKV